MRQSSENWLVRIYQARIGPTQRPSEAYGYWMLVVGLLLTVSGVAAFVAVEMLALTASIFGALVVLGLLFVTFGPVLSLLGIVVRLPLQPLATVLGGLGATGAIGSVLWVILVVPPPFTPEEILLPVGVYLGGIVVILFAMIVVPLSTTADNLPTSADSPQGGPYYTIDESTSGWIWRLYDRNGETIAESEGAYKNEDDARVAIERMAVRAPMAGVELKPEGGES